MARDARDPSLSCSQDMAPACPTCGRRATQPRLKGLNRWLWSLPMGASPCPPHPRQSVRICAVQPLESWPFHEPADISPQSSAPLHLPGKPSMHGLAGVD